MNTDNSDDNNAIIPETDVKKGDDTVSAVATNYVYKVIVKDTTKPEPTLSKEKLESYKATISKYRKEK